MASGSRQGRGVTASARQEAPHLIALGQAHDTAVSARTTAQFYSTCAQLPGSSSPARDQGRQQSVTAYIYFGQPRYTTFATLISRNRKSSSRFIWEET